MQPTELVARIEAAFPDPGYPPDRRPCNHHCEECDELSEMFHGKRWHEILAVPMFPDLNAAPSILSDDAFGYFLPALMIGCLNDPKAADATLDFLGWSLLETRKSSPKVLGTLSTEARNATYDWLRWWIDHDELEDGNLNDTYDRYVHERAEEYREQLRALRSAVESKA